jgi:hypothetical protein
MKLDQIVVKTFGQRMANATYVKILKFKAGRDKKGFAYAAAQTYSRQVVNVQGKIVPATDKNKYVSKFTFLDKKLNVKCTCSCPDFMFTFEWALARKGAADINFSNGDPPDDRNPGYRPGCCKHLIALRKLIKQKYNI